MSMTKSVTGLLAEILVVEGALDETALVVDIIPEIADSAFADATVRQVMDMTTGVAFSEDYGDPDADIWRYSAAASPFPRPEGHYRTINSDMLGWIIARTAQRLVAELASERLWRSMGAEQDAYMAVDGRGVPFAGGGLSLGLRDLARIGLLMLNGGEIQGERLFPAEVVERIRAGGDPAKFSGYPTIPNGSYTSQWWVFHNDHGAFAARGVHGQALYVDPTAEMVLVRFASFPHPQNALIDPTSLPAFQAVAEFLMAQD